MTRPCLLSIVAVFCLASLPTIAQDLKPPPLPSGDLFFTAKGKQPTALERVHPGLIAALGFTDEQKLALAEARRTTLQNDDLIAAGQAVKSNPNATEAQRENVRMLQDEARDKLGAVIEQVLTADQKAFIVKIQQAYNDANQAAMAAAQPDFAAAKSDATRSAEARNAFQVKVKDELARRLDQIFTDEQRAAVQQAAKAQAEQEERAAQNPKRK